MKSFRPLVIILGLALLTVFSCHEEDECDTTDFAPPEILLLEPENGVIILPWDGPPSDVKLHLKAEAGLNILSTENTYGDIWPMHAFTNGEKEIDHTFNPDYYYGDGAVDFIIYDLCNQSARVEVRFEFEPSPEN